MKAKINTESYEEMLNCVFRLVQVCSSLFSHLYSLFFGLSNENREDPF